MSENRQDAEWHELAGPTYAELGHRDTIGWHYHDVQQLVYPSSGVLAISAAAGTWVVPPQRAVWIPARVPHAHRAHGPVQLRTLAFSPQAAADPPLPASPAVLEVSPLLREIIVALTGDGTPYTARQRTTMEQVALDQLRRVGQLPVRLPALADDRLRAIAALLRADPADERTLTELGTVVGASERTLSRLFRQEAGMSFPQWRTQFRLQHALVLLADRTPVTTTALACGWSNPSAFIETFRRSFGTTPGKFYADAGSPALFGPRNKRGASAADRTDDRPKGSRMVKLSRGHSADRQVLPPFEGGGPAGAERATFAAGCFWGVEAAFRDIPGVLRTAVGYTGGDVPGPSYRQVCGGRTGHAEAVEVWFDPAQVSYAQLLETFWRIHNPTTRNRQGLDFGSQYRSAIFCHGADQQAVAISARDAEQRSRKRQIVTQITPASAFYRAEEYHQRYLEKHGRVSCAVTAGDQTRGLPPQPHQARESGS